MNKEPWQPSSVRVADRFGKFMLIGVVNTTLGVLLHYVFLELWQVNVYFSYCVVFTIVVGVSYILNSRYNYYAKLAVSDFLKFYRSYIISGLVGLVVLIGLKSLVLPISDFWLVLSVIPIKIVMTFVLVDLALMRRRQDAPPNVARSPNRTVRERTCND